MGFTRAGGFPSRAAEKPARLWGCQGGCRERQGTRPLHQAGLQHNHRPPSTLCEGPVHLPGQAVLDVCDCQSRGSPRSAAALPTSLCLEALSWVGSGSRQERGKCVGAAGVNSTLAQGRCCPAVSESARTIPRMNERTKCYHPGETPFLPLGFRESFWSRTCRATSKILSCPCSQAVSLQPLLSLPQHPGAGVDPSVDPVPVTETRPASLCAQLGLRAAT